MTKKIIITVFILFNIQYSLANDCGEFLDGFTSPVCTDAKYIFWSGAALTLAVKFFKPGFAEEAADRAAQKNHLKTYGAVGGDIGYGYLNGLYMIGQYVLGGSKGAERAGHMMEASFLTLSTTMVLKKSIYEGRPGYPDDPDSFPSGHSSFSFVFASVVTAQHGMYWGGLAHAAATFIAFSRINDEWHYLHDVLAGMTIGMSYGWGVYYNKINHDKPYWFSLLPTANLQGVALNYGYRF